MRVERSESPTEQVNKRNTINKSTGVHFIGHILFCSGDRHFKRCRCGSRRKH